MELEGEDHFGKWKGSGAFMNTNQGPFFWMLKFYSDKERAGQTGAWNTLLYESTRVGDEWCDGRWFF